MRRDVQRGGTNLDATRRGRVCGARASRFRRRRPKQRKAERHFDLRLCTKGFKDDIVPGEPAAFFERFARRGVVCVTRE
jgi:hypothetical protein